MPRQKSFPQVPKSIVCYELSRMKAAGNVCNYDCILLKSHSLINLTDAHNAFHLLHSNTQYFCENIRVTRLREKNPIGLKKMASNDDAMLSADT